MDYVITAVLLACSAIFSGLTLGIMGLSTHGLARKARLGDARAIALYPLRRRGNQLLTTLLLGNVAVNSTLAVYLGSIAPGVVAGFIATGLIFLLGEIIPQAVFSRHGLNFGARFAPLARALMWITWPVTYPIGYALDRILGEELPTLYSKRELMEIISEHEDSAQSPIDSDEERIMHGALQFSHKTVAETMTARGQVSTVAADSRLSDRLRLAILEEGYSRVPVMENGQVVGLLFAKDLLEKTDRLVRDVCDSTYLRARPEDTLDTVLARMLRKRQHMAIVQDEARTFLGVITLEDILEEVIQYEILDEDDEDPGPQGDISAFTETRASAPAL